MDKLEKYINEYLSAGSEIEASLLNELERATNLRVIQPKMISGRIQGAFLTLITKIIQPKLVLEIGTFTGYSALSIAAGLEDGAKIHTIEIDDELEDLARSFFDRSSNREKINFHLGSALEIVPSLAKRLGRPFDMIFIDGDKREYSAYYQMLMGDGAIDNPISGSVDQYENNIDTPGADGSEVISMVASGTVILADNVLWYGKVADPEAIHSSDRMSQGIIEFNRMVAADPRVENVILPLRDGINLIRVK